INALGVAPTGATVEFYKEKGYDYPPQYGPLAAVTPGTPGGLMTMLAEYGTMSLKQVLAPALEMAKGYPMEAQTADRIESNKEHILKWPDSKRIFLTNTKNGEPSAPQAGEIFVQEDLARTISKLIEAESNALKKGKNRKEAIYAAYDRFYKGDIAKDLVEAVQEQGGLFTMGDLANWEVKIEEPLVLDYKGIEVYKLTTWVQSPVMLQALNMAEELDLKGMGYNSANYIHSLYQIMNMSFADRDFYYGDPYFEPKEPIQGLLSKEYAKQRLSTLNMNKNDRDVKPGDPYKFQGGQNPYLNYIESWNEKLDEGDKTGSLDGNFQHENFPNSEIYNGTTSIQAADKEGWVVSITPSGGWVPAVIAGNTGIGLSQRAQSFVLDERENPFNVIEPGKRPRATLTPTLALKDGKPYLSCAVQGGDSQDQNLLQFFLNMVEFGMNVQEAAEAANFNSYQMRGSFGQHESEPGKLLINEETPAFVRKQLEDMGYDLQVRPRTSGPINAIYFDWDHGTFWGGSSNFGEDYGIGW
ncbi:MAG: gamma-glutamyltransferase, partial [Flavobacteriaceae bacterium]|nr:gamma-glutamyltransferase [Flavobacteriaceae bacterium]